MWTLNWLARAALVVAGLIVASSIGTGIINGVGLYAGLLVLFVLDGLVVWYALKSLACLWDAYRAWRYLDPLEPTSLQYCVRKRLTIRQVDAAKTLHRSAHDTGDDMDYCQLTIKDFLEN